MQITAQSLARKSPGFSLDKIFRIGFISRIRNITQGQVTINDPVESLTVGSIDEKNSLQVTIDINNLRFYRLLATKGALGAAEAYILGYWNTHSLVSLIRIMAINTETLETFEKGTATLQKPMAALFSFLTRNTLNGSKENIRAHYDLSNDMFKLFLDSSMMYSANFFKSEEYSLEQATEARLERICRKMKLQQNEHILEIGTGWGGFAIYAAKHYGCTVTTTTISDEQYQYAFKQIHKSKLQGKIKLLKKDYRELDGTFDKLVSIEMIEAVGDEFLPEYLKKCSSLVKSDGIIFLQAITINDQIYDRALKEIDFIKKYIFPGSFIPSLHAILTAAKNNTKMRLYHLEDLTPHYAKTLLAWRERFLSHREKLNGMGFDEKFIRMWDYYFCYCAGGFLERSIGSVHLIFANRQYRDDLSLINDWK